MSSEDDRGQFDLSRRKLLGSVATIGAAGAIGGAGTMAFFSDEEEFANNQLTAGELDMKVDYSAHYSDWSDDEADGLSGDIRMWNGDPGTTGTSDDLNSGEVGLPTNDNWLIAVSSASDADTFLANTQTASAGVTDVSCDPGDNLTDADDLPDAPVINLPDVKPGDFGEVTFSFRLCDNPGYVWLQGGLIDADENGTSEPEADDEDEIGVGENDPLNRDLFDNEGDEDNEENSDPANTNQEPVELLDEVQYAVWVDDGGDGPDGNEDGNNYQNGTETLQTGTLRELLGNGISDGFGVPLEGDIAAADGGGTGRNCFSGDTEHFVGFAWWLAADHANEIQTDSVSFDLSFYTEQCRHNDGSGQPGFGNQDS